MNMKTEETNAVAPGNPFTKLAPRYEKAKATSQNVPEAEAAQAWTRNRRSVNGARSPHAPVVYVLPISGRSVEIGLLVPIDIIPELARW